MNKRPDITDATQAKLIDAYWELSCYKNKEKMKVNVCKIADKAGVHRSTFYQYFNDLYDIRTTAEYELIESLVEDYENNVEGKITDIKNISKYLIPLIMRHSDRLITSLIGFSSNFHNTIIKRVRPLILSILNVDATIPNLEYLTAYGLSAITGLIRYWNDQGRKVPLETVFAIGQKLITSGLDGYVRQVYSNN